jgi:hypothetical protein
MRRSASATVVLVVAVELARWRQFDAMLIPHDGAERLVHKPQAASRAFVICPTGVKEAAVCTSAIAIVLQNHTTGV